MKTLIATVRQRFFSIGGLLAACAITASVASAQVPRIASQIVSTQQSTLKHSLHPMAQAQYNAGRLPSDTPFEGITLVFNRSAAQEADLKALIAAQQNSASPEYHRWLKPEQFAARFGMSDADIAKAQSWLQEQGFTINSIARSKNAIHFSGTARQVEQAFATEMHIYKINGTEHFAPSTDLSVPSAIAPTVLAIDHLNNFRPRAHVVLPKDNAVRPAFTSSQSGNVFLAPGDIATIYDIKPLYSASITGLGQTIAIVGQSAIVASDIEAFQSAAGLTKKDPIQILVPNTGSSTISTGDETESDLDIEWSGAIAPGATIQFVYTGNSSNNSGAFDSIAYAIDQDLAPIISGSYGTCETELGSFSLESSFSQAATQGQTVISAAGDSGSTDCYGISGLTTTQQQALAVDYPASSPNVTAMGGTEISSSNLTAGGTYWSAKGSTDTISSALQYIPEISWNDDGQSGCSGSNCLSATGGGASALFSKPTWQTGVSGIPSDGKRDLPDISLLASPSNPGFLYCSSDTSTKITGSCSNGFRDSSNANLTVAGGTSFDAPIFAGILALINQKAGYTEGQGLINPTLYSLAATGATYASAFHDITTGNNSCSAGTSICGSTTGFTTGSGYDQVTGLGSIDAANLADFWPVNSGSTSTLISTTTSVSASTTSPTVGDTVTFTITVASTTGTTVPTGSLSLIVDGGTAISQTLTSNGTFTYTTSFSTAGAHTILAKYAGDSTHATSSSGLTVTAATSSSGKGTISMTSTPATLTVARGSSGSETLTVTPSGGYTGTTLVTFTTSNNTTLQNLCYAFSSQNTAGNGTIAISGTAAGTVQLTLDTKASDCSSSGAVRSGATPALKRLGATTTSSNNHSDRRIPLSIAFAGLLLCGFIGRSSRKLRGLAAILLLAAAGLAVTACGSSTSTTVSNPPKGTYTVTATATDSATSTITANTTFTFTIN